ncbi:MAG: signal peptidase I [Thermoleophilia bacterium]|nr:signal peptidase I [Thermoleophilia bacterium]
MRTFVKDFVLPVAVAVTLAFVIQASLAKPYEIPTNSMYPAIQGTNFAGDRSPDRVVANRVIYLMRDIARGDIVVFDPTVAARSACSEPGDVPFVKRVIGTSGDVVSVEMVTISAQNPDPDLRPGGALASRRMTAPDSFGPDDVRQDALGEGDVTYVTYVQKAGQAKAHPFVVPSAITPTYEVTFSPVPDGQVLLLGDNRPGSCDAHIWVESGNAFTPGDNVIGQAEVIYWPLTRMRFLS